MKSLIVSLKALIVFTLLTGLAYPILITGFAQVFFREKANGSMIKKGEKTVGSSLIGQQFNSAIYFTSRPSATDYNPMPSGASNSGITSLKLKELVYYRQGVFITFNKSDTISKIPSEMVFASASGLDPHISPTSAFLQADRIAEVRNYDETQKIKLKQLIQNQIETPQLFCLGNERINVLLLNLEVDMIK
jgi:K+-transporting ATPase ATPase C chain